MKLAIRSRITVALDIVALELAAPDDGALPEFEPGAHIDLHLDNGLTRSYSLVNSPLERDRYVVAVQRDAGSRGGSRHVHDSLRIGQILEVDAPRNNFKLVEDAPLVVLIAGGIGITPLYCMVQRLEHLGRPWKLFYGARSRERCAYLHELLALDEKAPGRVRFHFNEEHGGQVMDMAEIVAGVPPEAHLYCCGPKPMLEAFEGATSSRPEQQVHVEYFIAKHAASSAGGFQLVLARKQRSLFVAPGKSILDTLLDAGLDTTHCCKEGVCGACQTTVIEGEPDHRDSYLSPAERRSGKTIMLCCSGSKSPTLVLDL